MRFYLLLNRLGQPRSYLGKVLLVGFFGIHVPLAGAIGYLLAHEEVPIAEVSGLLATILVATLIGGGVTLACLSALLVPVRDAGDAVERYLADETMPRLPTHGRDEAGRLMSGIQDVLVRLDALQACSRSASEEARGRFALISAMSHELRTPLNHIIGFAEVIATESLGPLGQKSYRSYAADIGTSGGRLLAVLETLLEFSEIAAGGNGLKPSSTSLAESLQGATAVAQHHARAAQVDLRLSTPSTLTVYADPRALKLKQILLHAIVATVESAGANRIVRVIAFAEGGVSLVEIGHDGRPWRAAELPPAVLAGSPELGVPANDAPIRSTTPEALRLSLVHSLCLASGGRVALRPGKNGGRLLRLALPAVDGVVLRRSA